MTTETNNPADQDISTCANFRCNCPVKPGDKYCCENCEKQQNGDVCSCGHSECQSE
jgi:hypothetical protein